MLDQVFGSGATPGNGGKSRLVSRPAPLRRTARALAADAEPSAIQHIDLVHLSHTDVGFTDHPIICRELQRRYLDIAIDAVLATRDRPESARFCWTAESTIGVNDWWQSATPGRRAGLFESGRLGSTGRGGHRHEQHALSERAAMAQNAALAAGRPLAAGPTQRGHARRRERHAPRRRDGPARPRHSSAADGNEHPGLPAAARATVGLLVEDARRTPAVRLHGLLLSVRALFLRSGGMAARAGAAGRRHAISTAAGRRCLRQ